MSATEIVALIIVPVFDAELGNTKSDVGNGRLRPFMKLPPTPNCVNVIFTVVPEGRVFPLTSETVILQF